MRVFISSTFRDLRAERDGAMEVLKQIEIDASGMELFPSEPNTPLAVALRELALSDAVILILGFHAGSLIPEEPGRTYTSVEFERARELGRPVFVFIKTESGEWVNKETDVDKRRVLDDFRRQIGLSPCTPSYFQTADQLRTGVAVAFHRWQEAGRPGARKVFSTAEEFFAPFRPRGIPRLFDYEQTLQGRDEAISCLDSFVKDQSQLVLILVGRGGIGKTKLLRDWYPRVSGRDVLFARRSAAWHAEAGKELPVGDLLIVCDDAQHFDHLEELLDLVAEIAPKQNVKLLLATRPSSSNLINSRVLRTLDATQTILPPRLERLPPDGVKALAEEVLGESHKRYADSLAWISGDTPLVTVVGGRLVARGEIPPELLNNEQSFRREVLSRFSEEYERLLPPSPVVWRDLLQLLAALGPIAPRSDSFAVGAEPFLRARRDEILSATDILEKHGLLIRGGSMVRIVPDVLADFLLEQACVNAQSEPTGYAEAAFAQFGGPFLSNILRNLAELDWRISQRQPSRNLLRNVWEHIAKEFETADAGARAEILRRLEGTAYLQPEPILGLVRTAMDNPVNSDSAHGPYSCDQTDVLEQVPKLLEAIVFHPHLFHESMKRLWILAREDKRPPNSYPNSAPRILKELASYTTHKDVSFMQQIADFSSSLLDQDKAFDSEFTPLDLMDCLLEKEGEGRESDGLSMRMWSFELKYEAVKPIREKAFCVVERALFMSDLRIATRALKSVQDVLAGHLGAFGRAASEREHDWQNAERFHALDIIERRVKAGVGIPLLRQILASLRRLRPDTGNEPLCRRYDEVLAGIVKSDSLIVFDTFCTDPWERDLEGVKGELTTLDLARADALRESRVKDAVRLFRSGTPGKSDQLRALEIMATDAASVGINVSTSSLRFVQELCSDRQLVLAFAEQIRTSQSVVASWPQAVLWRLREFDQDEYLAYGINFANHSDPGVVGGTAGAILSSRAMDEPLPADIAILEGLSSCKHDWVKKLTFMSLGRLGKLPTFKDKAVDIFLRIEIGDSEKLADELCGSMDYGNMPPSSLTKEQIAAILKKLVPVVGIDEHHVGRFLDWVGRNYPSLLFDFIMRRLDHYSALRKADTSSVHGYRPVPHHEIGTHFHSLRDAAQYSDFLRGIRDRITDEREERFWLCDLFWAIGGIDVLTLTVLDEWLHMAEEEKLRILLNLLSEAPEGLAFAKPFFAAQVVECFEEISSDLGRRAIGRLIGNATKGISSGAHGQPPPKFVSIRDRAGFLADAFPHDSAGNRFFSNLRSAAMEEIERWLTHDADFDMERGAI